MSNLTQLQSDLEDSSYLKSITQALSEIAALKLKMTRSKIEHNGRYFTEISNLFYSVKMLAAKKRQLLGKDLSKSTIARNGKAITILITSNLKFYGGLDTRLVRFYSDQTSKLPADRIVIGATGQEMLKAWRYPHSYQSVKLKSDFPSLQELQSLMKVVTPYSQILVYFCRFQSLLNQPPQVIDLLQSAAEQQADDTKIDYILEPEVEKILEFFESQIFTLLMESIFLQTQLARIGARMVSMNQAEQNADKLITSQKLELLKARKQVQNIQIIEAFTGRITKKS